jgi:outer membrane cobalamin receptor
LTITLPAYSLLNGVVSCDVGKGAQLFVRLDNILDTPYQMVYGYGTLGFSIQVGVQLII